VISCGVDNDYGHPSPLTVGAWQDAGAMVVRTDLLGDVIVVGRPGAPPSIVTRSVASAP
jgi:competence protein ComEC